MNIALQHSLEAELQSIKLTKADTRAKLLEEIAQYIINHLEIYNIDNIDKKNCIEYQEYESLKNITNKITEEHVKPMIKLCNK